MTEVLDPGEGKAVRLERVTAPGEALAATCGALGVGEDLGGLDQM